MNKKRRHLSILDVLQMSISSLGANKLRSFLTMIGISIGVFSVVGVMTALSAVRQSIDTGLSVLGANTFQISKFPPVNVTGVGRHRFWSRPNLTYRQALEFQELMQPYATAITLRSQRGGRRVSFMDQRPLQGVRVQGTTQDFLLTDNFELAYGRNLTPEDVEFRRPVVVIGHRIEQELFPNQNPVGQWISVDNRRYLVVGVLARKGQLFGEDRDMNVLVPITRFISEFAGRWSSIDLSVMARDQATFDEAKDIATGFMRLTRGLQPDEENNFEVFSNDSLQESFARIANLVGIGGFIISAIALLAAGIGVMNIMLVSVTERTREIGVRKSIGARSKDILSQFLLEAIFLSLIGGAIGILLGVAGGNIAATQLQVEMIFPWLWAGIAVGICTAIGLLFGAYPAYKAAGLNPIEALRYE